MSKMMVKTQINGRYLSSEVVTMSDKYPLTKRFTLTVAFYCYTQVSKTVAFQIAAIAPIPSMHRVTFTLSSSIATVFNTKSCVNRLKSRWSSRIFSSNSQPPSSMAEKVLQNPQWPVEWPYSVDDFTRMDEADDTTFYSQPRLVYHIDDACVSALTQYYSEVLCDSTKTPDSTQTTILDLCSSWVSHFPTTLQAKRVIGLGMNEYELKQNKQLTSYVVQDLNSNPSLPFEDNTFDIVTCVVSIDYLNKPLQVCAEIGRVLKVGGKCMISISNRCFPTKAFRIWLQTSDLEHVFIVGSFFHFTNLFEPPVAFDRSPNPGRSDPLYIIQATKK